MADDAAAGVRTWLTRQFGEPVTEFSPPVSIAGGFDHDIYSIQYAGEHLPPQWRAPLIARTEPRGWRYPPLQRETQLQDWCAAQGYPAPRPLALLAPGEAGESAVQVIERAPGRRMDEAMTAQPWRIFEFARILARLSADLHRLGVPAWADGDQPDWSVLDRRLALVRYVVDSLGAPDLVKGLEAVEKLTAQLRVADPTLCHGDLHPLNVLVDGSQAAVIDWTDAGVGDRHADIARTALLFRFAALAAPGRAERTLMSVVGPSLARTFLTAYNKQLPIDPARLRLWTPVHMLHNWAQIVADEAEITGPSVAGVRYRRGLGPLVQRQFERAISVVP